jgi:hypothetical protein
MPTVLRLGGLRVVVYPNDHRPAHVHVIGSDQEAVFRLNWPAELHENYGFSRSEITAIRSALGGCLGILCKAWEQIHGSR